MRVCMSWIAPEIDPEIDPEIVPEIVPEIAPEIDPEIVPEIDPEIDPEIVPEIAPDTAPDTAPEIAPEIVPEIDPEIVTHFHDKKRPPCGGQYLTQEKSVLRPAPPIGGVFALASDLVIALVQGNRAVRVEGAQMDHFRLWLRDLYKGLQFIHIIHPGAVALDVVMMARLAVSEDVLAVCRLSFGGIRRDILPIFQKEDVEVTLCCNVFHVLTSGKKVTSSGMLFIHR